MITKQDIQKIAAYMKRLSVRDTELPALGSVDDNTRVAVVQDNQNRLTYMAAILAYVISNIDLASMHLDMSEAGLQSTTLSGLLAELKTLITTHYGDDGNEITSYDIFDRVNPSTGNRDTIGASLDDLRTAIDTLIALYEGGIGLTEEQEELLTKLAVLLASTANVDFTKLSSTKVTALETAASNFNNNTPQYQTATQVAALIATALEEFKMQKLQIKDSLDSEATDWALSANQGRILKQAIMDLTNALANLAFIGERPYTGQQNWNITEGFNVTIYNESKSEFALVINNTVVASESFTVKYPQGSSNTIKVYVRPVNNTRFLDSVSYSVGEYNPYQRVTITEDNKREVLITLTGIDSDTIIKVKGTTRAAIQYNVTYPDDSYLSFPDNAPNVVLEGSTFSIVATVSDDVPNTLTYKSVTVKMGNVRKTINFIEKRCSIEMADVNGNISMEINKVNTGTTYQVTGLSAGNGYTWDGELTAYEGQDYSIIISPSIGYILTRIGVTHGGNTRLFGLNQSGANEVVVSDVSSDIVFSVSAWYVGVTGTVTVSAGSLVDLTLSPEEATVTKGNNYYGILSLASGVSGKRLPNEITIAPQSEQGTGLLSAPNMSTEIGGLDPYDEPTSNNSMFTSFDYNNNTGNIIIYGVRQNLTISATAQSDVDTVKVTFKWLNIDDSDLSGYNQDVFGYRYTYVPIGEDLEVSIAAKNNAELNGDIRVWSDGEPIFEQGGLSNSENVELSNGTLTITSSILANATDIIIEATAYTGIITVEPIDDLDDDLTSAITVNGSSFTLSADESTVIDEISDDPITAITSLSFSSAALSAIKSIDFGGLKCSVGSPSSIGGLFYNMTSVASITGLVLVTPNAGRIKQMFCGCSNLSKISTVGWDLSNVENFAQMYKDCKELKTVDVFSHVTDAATNLNMMFNGCSMLESIDVNSWDVSNVTDLGAVFSKCFSLTLLDIRNWTTTSVTRITSLFDPTDNNHGSRKLVIGNFDTSNIDTWSTGFVTRSANIYCTTDTPPAMGDVNWLSKVSGLGNIYIPGASVEDSPYASDDHPNWKAYLSKLTPYTNLNDVLNQ